MTEVILTKEDLPTEQLELYERWLLDNHMYGQYASIRTGYSEYTSLMRFYDSEDAVVFKLRFGL